MRTPSKLLFASAFALLLAGCGETETVTNEVVVEPAPIAEPAEIETIEPTIIETAPRIQREFSLGGSDLDLNFRQIDGTTVMVTEDHVMLSSTIANPPSTGRTNSPYLIVPRALEAELAGEAVKITVNACAPEIGQTRDFAVAYSTQKYGNSGWNDFSVGSACEDVSFTYTVPGPETGEDPSWNGDYIGINPDTSGQGQSLHVQSVTIETLN